MTEHRIQVLENIDAVRTRPEMYVGDTEGKSTHLVFEVLDNAVDEVLRGTADSIWFESNQKTATYSVADNGGGLPVHIIDATSTKPEGDSVEVAFTILHSSGKFDSTVYKNSGGLHGVGLVCVNALSEFVTVLIRRKGDVYYKYEFIDGVLDKNEKYPTGRKLVKLRPENAVFSTKITWKVSPDYYKNFQIIDEKTIKDKLELVGTNTQKKMHWNGVLLENLTFRELLDKTFFIQERDIDIKFHRMTNTNSKGDRVDVTFCFTPNDINYITNAEVNLIPRTGKFI